MTNHATFAPSASFRWLNCPGSALLERDYPRTTTVAAERGTFFHAVAEAVLADGLTIKKAHKSIWKDWSGTGLTTPPAELPDVDLNTTEDMVGPYVDFVRGEIKNGTRKNQKPELMVEARLIFSVDPDCHGTGDVVLYYPATRGVDLIDLKTGTHPVSPVENTQLGIYLVAAIRWFREIGYPVNLDNCRTVIWQGGRAKIWTPTFEQLVDMETTITEGLEKAAAGETYKSGPWCRWCQAKKDCGEFNKLGLAIAKKEFADTPAELSPASLETMDAETANTVLDAINQFGLWSTEAVEILTRRAKDGLDIPGYRVIESVKHKKWKNPKTVQEELIKRIPKGKTITLVQTKTSLRTPAQLTKEFPKGKIEDLWEVPKGEPRLVTEDSPGKPWKPDSAETVETDFSEKPKEG